MNEPRNPPDFEASLNELEKLVARMEQGELPLKDSLDEFERGVQLVGHCESALREAEQRVEMLLKSNEQTQPKRFES